MNIEPHIAQSLIRQYYDACNRRDVDAVLKLKSPKAYYYDAFWHESCARENMAAYYQSWFNEARKLYFTPLITIEAPDSNWVVLYSARDQSGFGGGPELFRGVEFFRFSGGLIDSIFDHYFETDENILQEAAAYQTSVYQPLRYAKSGLRAAQISGIKSKLIALMDDGLYLQKKIKLAQLAKLLGCSPNHLSQIINAGFGQSLNEFLNKYRVDHARQILINKETMNSELLSELAHESGFASVSVFYRAFKSQYKETPMRYWKKSLEKE